MSLEERAAAGVGMSLLCSRSLGFLWAPLYRTRLVNTCMCFALNMHVFFWPLSDRRWRMQRSLLVCDWFARPSGRTGHGQGTINNRLSGAQSRLENGCSHEKSFSSQNYKRTKLNRKELVHFQHRTEKKKISAESREGREIATMITSD